MAAAVVPGPGPNQQTQVRILDTQSSVPTLRTEEIIDTATSQVVLREEMAGSHALVTLGDNMSPEELQAALPDQLVSFSRVTPSAPVYRFNLASTGLTALPEAIDAINTLTNNSGGLAEPDFVYHTCATPDDPDYLAGKLWGLHNIGQDGGTDDADIDAPEGWNARTGSDVVVAIIDTGVRYTHEDLAANMWTNPNEIPANGIDDDGNGYIDDIHGINAITGSGNPDDDEGHGTHCAGTVGAVGNNGKGVTGVAWSAQLMACKFLDAEGSGFDSDAIECIDYAIDMGAKVLSNSWGGGSSNAALKDAIARAQAKGVVFVAAAGNDGADNDATPHYPSSYDLDNIVAVAATNRNDELADFSNYGLTSVDLAAPGVSIYSTTFVSNTSYGSKSGTSMATPHVSGVFVLLAAEFPLDSYSSLISRVLTKTDPLASLAGKCVTGGRLNLYKAIQNTNPRPTPTPRPTPVPPPPTPTRRTPVRITPTRPAPGPIATPTPMATATPVPTATPQTNPTPRATATPRPTATPRF